MIPLCDRVNDFNMEEIAFSDWPGQPVDLISGNNPWMPAYGFQTPTALLEKDDFIGNPDAEYFLQNNTGQYMYLETIQEETSDDLRSESDVESRGSPVGWLATDSETGSVICMDEATDEIDCISDRELACPAKRRKHDFFLTIPIVSDEDGPQSLSRSSSLLQFETLEKQCQETCSSSPSLYSQFSYDSLEIHNRRNNASPDSLERTKSDNEEELEYYKSLKIDIPVKKDASRDSLLYNATIYSESSDSDETLAASRSFDNLKTWKSFESLQVNNDKSGSVKLKASVENLSEDSGYSDHLSKCTKSASSGMKTSKYRHSYVGFSAYDGDVFQNFQGNFGVSYQDLTNVVAPEKSRSPLIERFMKKRFSNSSVVTKVSNIESSVVGQSKYTCDSAPNLLRVASATTDVFAISSIINQTVCVCSVPKDLNLIGELNFVTSETESVASKNWDLTDFASFNNDHLAGEESDESEMNSYRREGSYAEAMSNRVDLSDDEHSLCYKKKPGVSTPIVEFDKKVLKAISETSIQSLASSHPNVNEPLQLPPPVRYINENFLTSTPKRNVVSTPNLALMIPYFDDERRRSTQEIHRKNSIIKSSESGMSDFDDKTLTSAGSTNSKGVHFSPVVSEVNWHDDSVSTATPERESLYSLSSSTPEREPSPPTPILERPKVLLRSSMRGRSLSQPDLSDSETNRKQEYIDTLKNLRKTDISKSQPDVGKLKRRGSQLVKKDKDGCVIKAYVDVDGIQYKHTHLDLNTKPPTHHATGASASSKRNSAAGISGGGNTNAPRTERNLLQTTKPVGVMEAQDAHHDKHSTKSRAGKLGGFFSRLASFRFSARKGAEEKNKIKKKSAENATNKPKGPVLGSNQQRVATKEDYIFIPLKGPSANVPESPRTNFNNNVTCSSSPHGMSAKPPLPKQPPRVVHASVKRDGATPASVRENEPRHRHRRRTIDSGPPMEPMGLIETDLDTEVTVITSGAHAKTRSLLNLGAEPRLALTAPEGEHRQPGSRPHKSMEFLLDKQNLKVVEPPENELQKGERVMSEHQLRVQRSLQKLHVPDWYKQSQIPREGFLLKKQSRETRWTGTSTSANNKTTSLSSLASHSPVILSPIPTNQSFVRWSTSKLNSTASSPCASTRSSFNTRQPNGSISPSSVRSSFSYRQPYMGWRSQERLTRPRTPAERLASSILSQSNHQHHPQESPEIQTSIKEVTSAIVHYVSGLRPEDRNYDSQDTASQRSLSVSPRGSQKFCWLESSFVGTKPLDSPQTPVTLSENQNPPVVPTLGLRLDLQTHNDVTLLTTTGSATKPSPSSTTLEDVLDSLLGLPSTGRAPSPSLQGTVSANISPGHFPLNAKSSTERRNSNTSETSLTNSIPTRRVSLNSSPVLRCRNSKCGRTALSISQEAGNYKNCHNCAYTYCSRSCRRAHWEKHRKNCLFSRIGTLCRQVIATAKENHDCLLHLSSMARRGFLSHGPGAVKCFFAAPEVADKFIENGFQSLGELTYVRWQDLLPSEMGPQLYAELVKMCKSYNPDSKLILYVSICVVSETPASGAVKWERQLVSRCAKIRLSKDIDVPERDYESPETLILFCPPIIGVKMLKLRLQVVANLQRQLLQYGVLMRRQYPEIYKQLNLYCEGTNSEPFKAVTVYPKDTISGKCFLCIIMLEADEDSLRQVQNVGVKVRTVDLLNYPFSD